jgi:hypothetical protein
MHSLRPLRPAHRLRRHTIATASVAAGVALGLAVTAGVTAASASANDGSASGMTLAAMTTTAPWVGGQPFVEPIGRITADARTTLAAAHQAVAAAEVVSADVAASGLKVGGATSVDTTGLRTQIERLTPLDTLPLFFVPAVTDKTALETQQVLDQTAALRSDLATAKAKHAAEVAAAKAKRAAEVAAAAKAKAKAQAVATQKRVAAMISASNSPAGARAAARQIAASQYGWGAGQFSCLESLWNRESGWNYRAYNAGSGATGIPQALPGSKMASIASDWRTNAVTQIRWGLRYIAGAYGSPCAAWGHSQATNWY